MGRTTAIASGARGTPWEFSLVKARGMSPSRDIMNSNPMRAAIAVFTALSSSRAKTTPTMKPKMCPKPGPKFIVPYCSARKRSMSSLRSIICGASSFGSESMAQPSSAVPMLTSMATGRIALKALRPTWGWPMTDPGRASSSRSGWRSPRHRSAPGSRLQTKPRCGGNCHGAAPCG